MKIMSKYRYLFFFNPGFLSLFYGHRNEVEILGEEENSRFRRLKVSADI